MQPATEHTRDLIDYLQALSTPTIALAAALIALAQVWIARQKFKFDLFERRWAVYQATRVLIANVVTHAGIADTEMTDFLRGIRGAGWLFNRQIEEYLTKQVWKQVCTLSAAGSVVNDGAHTPGYQDAVKAKFAAVEWIMAQDTIIDGMLGPYLMVDQPFWEWIAFWKRLAFWRRLAFWKWPPVSRLRTMLVKAVKWVKGIGAKARL